MYFYAPETRVGMINAFKNLKGYFIKVGSDFLDISMRFLKESLLFEFHKTIM